MGCNCIGPGMHIARTLPEPARVTDQRRRLRPPQHPAASSQVLIATIALCMNILITQHPLFADAANPLAHTLTGGPGDRDTGEGGFYSVVATPDGRHVVSGSWDGTVRVWDTADWSLARTLTGHTGYVYSLVVTPDGRYIVSGAYYSTVLVWDTADWSLARNLTGHTGGVSSVAVTPDGRYVVIGDSVWDTADWSLAHTLTGHTGPVESLVATPDGRYVVSGDSTVRVWNTADWSLARTLTGHTGYVFSLVVTTDGRYVVSGSWDSTVRVWDTYTADWSLARTLTGHTGYVYSLVATTDGRYVVSGAYEMRVWDTADWSLARNLTGHSCHRGGCTAYSLAATPDGRYIVSAGHDGTVRVWRYCGFVDRSLDWSATGPTCEYSDSDTCSGIGVAQFDGSCSCDEGGTWTQKADNPDCTDSGSPTPLLVGLLVAAALVVVLAVVFAVRTVPPALARIARGRAADAPGRAHLRTISTPTDTAEAPEVPSPMPRDVESRMASSTV